MTSKRKQKAADVAWAKQRALNYHKMVKRMATDEAFLFKIAGETLQDLSDGPMKIGDEIGASLLSVMGIRLQQISRRNKAPSAVTVKRRRLND